LSKDEPLVLRFRLIIHEGALLAEDEYIKSWDAYHADEAHTPEN
jgi:hypothetical protein